MRERPLLPSVLLGVGLGAFVDGIVMHQLLQWHHMVSAEGCCSMNSLAGLEDNTLADGLFHVVAWSVTVAGVVAAINAWRRGLISPPWSAHAGGLIAGWGLFNLVDSANHFILGLHHIRDDLGGPVGWDIGFLVLAIAQIGIGVALVRATRAAAPRPG